MPSTSMGSVMALEGERPFRVTTSHSSMSPQCPDCSRKRPWSEQQWTAEKCQKATYAAQRSKIVAIRPPRRQRRAAYRAQWGRASWLSRRRWPVRISTPPARPTLIAPPFPWAHWVSLVGELISGGGFMARIRALRSDSPVFARFKPSSSSWTTRSVSAAWYRATRSFWINADGLSLRTIRASWLWVQAGAGLILCQPASAEALTDIVPCVRIACFSAKLMTTSWQARPARRCGPSTWPCRTCGRQPGRGWPQRWRHTIMRDQNIHLA